MNTECIKVKDKCYLTVSDKGETNIIKTCSSNDSEMERKINLENLIEENKAKIAEMNLNIKETYPTLLAITKKKYRNEIFILSLLTLLAAFFSKVFTPFIILIAAPLIILRSLFIKDFKELHETITKTEIELNNETIEELEEKTQLLEKELSMLNSNFIEENVSFDSIPAMVRDEEETEELNRVKIRKLNLK